MMKIKLLLFIGLTFFCNSIFSQEDSLLFIKAKITTFNDTLIGYIKYNQSLNEKIKFKNDLHSKKIIKINTDTISKISFKNCEFVRITYEGVGFLAKIETEGLVCLYSDYKPSGGTGALSMSPLNSGFYLDSEDYYIRFDGKTSMLEKSNYKYLLKQAYKLDTSLVKQISKSNYSIVKEKLYDFTKDYNKKFEKQNEDRILKPINEEKLSSLKKFGLYFPLTFNNSFIRLTEKAKKEVFNNKNGQLGYSLGIGFYYNFSRKTRFCLDINYLTTNLYLDYKALSSGSYGTEYRVKERAPFAYFTINPKLEFQFNNFFTGFGFNFSIANFYHSNYDVFNSTGELIRRGDERNPILVKKKNNIVNVECYLGKVFTIKNNFHLSPFIAIYLPLNNTIDIGERYYDMIKQVNVQEGLKSFLLSFGIKIDFNK